MLLFFLLFISKTQSNKFIAEGSLSSLVEWGDKIGLFTVSPNGTSLSLVVIQPDLSVVTNPIHSDNRTIVTTVALDFDTDGKLDLLIAFQENDALEYQILWDLKGPPQKLGFFRVEPFIISEGYSPSVFTVDLNNTAVLYSFGKKRDLVSNKAFGPAKWAKIHCNHQISLRFPATTFFFSTPTGFEMWSSPNHVLVRSYDFPSGALVGQSSFYELDGTHVHVLPVCVDPKCTHWRIYAHVDNQWKVLFDCTLPLVRLTRVRSADLDLDGRSDLILPPLLQGGAYLLRRAHACPDCITTPTGHHFYLSTVPINALSVIAPFYLATSSAFLLVQNDPSPRILLSPPVDNHNRAFFYISLSVFNCPLQAANVRLFLSTFDSTQSTTSQTLLPSFSHQALHFPYLVFGLSLNPKFVPRVDAAHISNGSDYSQTWKSLIPNSHAFIIAHPTRRWQLEIFISFGKSLVYTGVSLAVLFFILMVASIYLKWREIVEDGREKYSEERRSLMSFGAW